MKLAANLSLLYPGLPLSSRMAAAAQDGFTGIEILFPYDIDAVELARLLDRHTLTLALVNTPLGPEGEKGLACIPGREADFLQAIQTALALCRATGCRIVHAMAGIPGPAIEPSTARHTLIDNLRLAAPLAAQAGVTLTLEALNHHDVPGYCYALPDQAADIIAAVDHDAVRLQFDLYHSQREGLDLPATLGRLLPLVHHVQFAHPDGRHEPDLSDPQVRDALRLLAREGYDGWVGCEYIPKGDTQAGLSWRNAYRTLIHEAQA